MVRLPLFRGSTRSSSTSQHDSGKNVKNNHNKPRRRKSFVDLLLIPPYNDRRRQNQMDTAYSIIKRSMVRRAEEGIHCHEHDNITTNNNNDHQPFRKKDPKLPTYDDNLDDVVDVNVNDNEIDNTRYGPFIKKWPRRKTKTKSKVTTNNNVRQSPTNTLCGRTTVTDESSSTQYNCRSRSSSSNNEESSPRDSHNMMSSGSLLTFRDIFRFNNNKSIDKVDLRCCEDGDNDDDKYDPDPDNPNDDKYECADVHHRDQQDHRTEEESIKNKEPQKDDDDHDHDHNLQELPIPRSEIIGKLFPMGYPNRFKSSDMISSADHHRQNLNSMITNESKITRTKLEPPISEKEEDEDSKVASISTSFDRSEIISSLFPMGHPNDIHKRQESGSNSFISVKDTIHTNNKQRNFLSTPCRDINSSSLKVQYSPTFDTIATSSDVDHQQQGREEQVLETTKPKNKYAYNPSECKETKERSSDCDCDDNVIGMVISFDPTWDLLTEETGPIDHTTSIMVRSRLKKFHEIENYADSLLGKISAEESSNDESILVDMFAGLKSNHESELLLSSSSLEELMFSISDPILDLQSSKNHHNFHPMVVVKEKNCVDNFELGFHFDSERYPSSVPSEEIEICFHPDDETSIEYDVSEEKGSMRKHYIDNGISKKKNRLDDDFGCVRNADQEQETSFDEYTDCFEYESDNNMHTPSTADTSISLQPYNMLCREQLFHTDNLSFVH